MIPDFIRRCLNLALIVLGLSALSWTARGADDEGMIRFFKVAKSDFDIYLDLPTEADREWMRNKYKRLQVWSPYFDDKLSWFPAAWAYKNSYAIKPDWQVFQEHPEWILKDAQGNLLYIPYRCANGTCPQYAGDFGNPEFRSHWLSEARQLVEKGYRGIWIDDVNLTWRVSDGFGNHVTPIDPRTGTAMLLSDWQSYFVEFMEMIRQEFPDTELAHNVVWYAISPQEPGDELRRQIQAADFINLERGATDRGLTGGTGKYGFETFLSFINFVHLLGGNVAFMDEAETSAEREYGLAAWLLTSSGEDLFNNNQLAWTAPGSWWEGFDRNLGTAPASFMHWQGVLRRDFTCGMVLLNQPDMPVMHVVVSDGYFARDGTPVTNVDLAARSAVILTKACDSDPPPRPPRGLTVD